MGKNYIDKLAYLHLRNKKILVTLSKGKDVWYIPGGKREGDETDKEALSREAKEELSIDLDQESLAYCGTFEAQAHGKPEGTIVRMTCYTGNYKGKMKPAAEIDKLDYFSYSQKQQTSLVDHLIFEALKKQGLLD